MSNAVIDAPQAQAAGQQGTALLELSDLHVSYGKTAALHGVNLAVYPGEVVALGEGVKRYEAGDRVCALVPGGGYAEYAVVHEDNALPVPPGLSFTEAAAIPETFFTVWTNVFDRGRLKAGETLLIHGGSSGIGTTAIMLAKAFGAVVVVTPAPAETAQAASLVAAAESWSPRSRLSGVKRHSSSRPFGTGTSCKVSPWRRGERSFGGRPSLMPMVSPQPLPSGVRSND